MHPIISAYFKAVALERSAAPFNERVEHANYRIELMAESTAVYLNDRIESACTFG